MCCNNLNDYLINYDRLLYVLYMNSMKNPAFTGSENGWRRTEPVTKTEKLALFCASHFPARKHEFGALNSRFSVRVFTGSARDALSVLRKACRWGDLETVARSQPRSSRAPPRFRPDIGGYMRKYSKQD
jgi:hypothetical protein